MKGTHKGLYALQAMLQLARDYGSGPTATHDIASQNDIPEKFLEAILLELKNAELLVSVRGAKGGYLLGRRPSDIALSEIIQLTEGAIAPFGDAEQLHGLANKDDGHRMLYEVFRKVRGAAADILENVTLADVIQNEPKASELAGSRRLKDKLCS